MAFNERTLMTVEKEKYDRITGAHIVLVGVGGVGGAVFECLVRFGVKKITILDFDTVDETNLNRQIISTRDAVGRIKVDVAKARGLAINPDCEINAINMFIACCAKMAKVYMNHYNDEARKSNRDMMADRC